MIASITLLKEISQAGHKVSLSLSKKIIYHSTDNMFNNKIRSGNHAKENAKNPPSSLGKDALHRQPGVPCGFMRGYLPLPVVVAGAMRSIQI